MAGSNGPIIASVIPVLNESEHIISCLESIVNQTYDSSKHMIIVLDGGSVDNTKRLIEDYVLQAGKDSPEIILVDNPENMLLKQEILLLKCCQKRWNTL